MANLRSRRVDLGALLRAPLVAMQWRLLLVWTVLLWLPTAIVALPLWRALGGLLDHSIHADAWAERFNADMFGDAMSVIGESPGWLSGVGLLSALLTALLVPLLNGMVVGSGRAGRALGFGHLLQAGVVEYGRMFRLMLWSLLPYAVMFAAVGMAFHMAGEIDDKAVLQSSGYRALHMALGLGIVLLVLVQALMESARAAFVADYGLRSATRALWRGLRQLLRRPFSTLLCVLVISAIGYGVAFALGVMRIQTAAIGTVGLLSAFALTQLAVLVIGWVHVARIFALAEIAASLPQARRGHGGRSSAL